MTEEKKDDVNEQQTFLNEHEELLQSINKNEGAPDEHAEEVPPAETKDPDGVFRPLPQRELRQLLR